MRALTHWDYRYLGLARHVASWSKDINVTSSKQVGAVITVDGHVASVGFNGFAQGVHDSTDRLNDRELKLMLMIHAEINAIHFTEAPLKGATIYTWPCMPCSLCAANIIQKKFRECISVAHDTVNWKHSFDLSELQFKEAGIDLILADERDIDYSGIITKYG